MPSPSAVEPAGVDLPAFSIHISWRLVGAAFFAVNAAVLAALASWSAGDPSLSNAVDQPPGNWLGTPGAIVADLMYQSLGLAALVALIPPMWWSWSVMRSRLPDRWLMRFIGWIASALLAGAILACFTPPASWPLSSGLGGLVGLGFKTLATLIAGETPTPGAAMIFAALLAPLALLGLWHALRPSLHTPPKRARKKAEPDPLEEPTGVAGFFIGLFSILIGLLVHLALRLKLWSQGLWARRQAEREELLKVRSQRVIHEPRLEAPRVKIEPQLDEEGEETDEVDEIGELILDDDEESEGDGRPATRVAARKPKVAQGKRQAREAQTSLLDDGEFELPPLTLLTEPTVSKASSELRPEQLEANARRLESVLDDFGVKGDIINVRPGPVVTLYELEPAPGIKSSRVISLADDIARSMSAISARVAVVPGRNAIGIELPNQTRETVFLRELLGSSDFEKVKAKLPICLGKTIGGEPVIADLARMPHLLIAGTTGSGKSVGINTMILSLLYRMTPEECRLIMIDPKMLELSTYDGIPHLLTPVVTEPAKAVVALKWAVREMEDRYRKMSKVGVRNIDGFNMRVAEAKKKGKSITRTVQTGFDKETGEAIFESEEFDLSPLPFIVVIVDEMADLMMVAGKDIEGAIQRLAQMARAAGIHLIMATQRPSVDVITGTIKANFPTRISFQVTSKIDSRTILGEQGAEQLLGNGDMLYMAGGGRIKRLHGPFVSDGEVEDVVSHLKSQGAPEYLEGVTEEEENPDDPLGLGVEGGSGDELYDKAVNIVLTDKKASTSYIQRRLAIGYNRAATLIEKMEKEGVISAPNHAGKREILVGDGATF